MDSTAGMIAVVSGTAVQDSFRAVIDRWRPALRLAGVVAETHGLADRTCNAGYLRDVRTGRRFAMFQDRGAGTAMCHLDASGVVAAAEVVLQDIADGCDLVVLSKFGKLEAAGKGLRGAFAAAMEARIPILTSVSPSVGKAWESFAAPGFVTLQADMVGIDAWLRTISAARAAAWGSRSHRHRPGAG